MRHWNIRWLLEQLIITRVKTKAWPQEPAVIWYRTRKSCHHLLYQHLKAKVADSYVMDWFDIKPIASALAMMAFGARFGGDMLPIGSYQMSIHTWSWFLFVNYCNYPTIYLKFHTCRNSANYVTSFLTVSFSPFSVWHWNRMVCLLFAAISQ